MRAKQYRVWDAENKEMIYLDKHRIIDFNIWGGGSIRNVGGDDEVYFYEDGYNDCPNRVMEDIGLEDVNGKLIFEGDIVTSLNNTLLKRVEYSRETPAFLMQPGNMTIIAKRIPIFKTAVIGNIFENPELLCGRQ